jgi:DNA-binding CsgD family transcriptional regulator
MSETRGFAVTSALYPALDPAQRRSVDQFLRADDVGDHVSLREPGNGTTDGYLTVHERTTVSGERRGAPVGLAPGLSEQLRSLLPSGLSGTISPRERQVAELLAVGFSNDEISEILSAPTETVMQHIYRTTKKLGLERRTQLSVHHELWRFPCAYVTQFAIVHRRPEHGLDPRTPRRNLLGQVEPREASVLRKNVICAISVWWPKSIGRPRNRASRLASRRGRRAGSSRARST